MSIFSRKDLASEYPLAVEETLRHDGVTAKALTDLMKKEEAAMDVLEKRFNILTPQQRLKAMLDSQGLRQYPDPNWPESGEVQACYQLRVEARKKMEGLGIVEPTDNDLTVEVIGAALIGLHTELGSPRDFRDVEVGMDNLKKLNEVFG